MKKNVKKINRRSALSGFLHKPKLLVALVFMLAFGGVGGYLIRGSYADSGTSDCPYYTFGPGNITYGGGKFNNCVFKIQQAYNEWSVSQYKLTYHIIGQDNSYGSQTYGAIKNFQASRNIGVDGIVGPQTWQSLCNVLHNRGLPDNQMGCYLVGY